MILLTADDNFAAMPSRLSWESAPPAMVAGAESWSRASRRLLDECRDEQGHRFPLRDELWITVYPSQGDCRWRAESDTFGPTVVGRAATADRALQDWRKRFRAIIQRYLELRPFEMTADDRALWARIQSVVDVARYKATKSLVIRQIGKVIRSRSGLTVVQWEDGATERVDVFAFDEVFSHFRIGQSFEAMVTRNPLTFRILRAEAVRRLPRQVMSQERSAAIWDRAIGEQGQDNDAAAQAAETDERFWLKPSE